MLGGNKTGLPKTLIIWSPEMFSKGLWSKDKTEEASKAFTLLYLSPSPLLLLLIVLGCLVPLTLGLDYLLATLLSNHPCIITYFLLSPPFYFFKRLRHSTRS